MNQPVTEWQPPHPDDIVVWEDHAQPGWYYDRWDGLYGSLDEALRDAPSGLR